MGLCGSLARASLNAAAGRRQPWLSQQLVERRTAKTMADSYSSDNEPTTRTLLRRVLDTECPRTPRRPRSTRAGYVRALPQHLSNRRDLGWGRCRIQRRPCLEKETKSQRVAECRALRTGSTSLVGFSQLFVLPRLRSTRPRDLVLEDPPLEVKDGRSEYCLLLCSLGHFPPNQPRVCQGFCPELSPRWSHLSLHSVLLPL